MEGILNFTDLLLMGGPGEVGRLEQQEVAVEVEELRVIVMEVPPVFDNDIMEVSLVTMEQVVEVEVELLVVLPLELVTEELEERVIYLV